VTLEELTPWLFGRTKGGIRWGLERTEALLASVGNPHRHFRSILIGGTNGKGSVAALTESVLRHTAERRVGLYTSPHLVAFSERIRIDGFPAADEAIAAAADRLRPLIEETGASFFEATTAIAFLAFAEAGVEVAVVEVGLGGRLDSTNVLEPLAVAITNVGLEHTDYLGETLEEIAREKAGILKRGIPAVVGIPAAEVASLGVVRERADEVGAPLLVLDEIAEIGDVRTSAAGTEFALRSLAWGDTELKLPLVGLHQARNAALAAELLALLDEPLRPDPRTLAVGLATTRWPGRMQIERIRGTTYVLDVAHNPDGARVLADTLERVALPSPRILVVGILGDKDWQRMLPRLAAASQEVILTTPRSAPRDRRWDPDAVRRWCSETLRIEPRILTDLPAALSRAATLAPHGTVIVTGSVHTVGDAIATLQLPN
jgi:dihydrofolate synthase / folylpolyglutamate synthase